MPWIILILFLIVVVIVWVSLTNNARKDKPDFKVEAHADESAHVSNPEPMEIGAVELEMPVDTYTATEPEHVEETPLSAPVTDDLTTIEGIGPKVSQLLHENGISTFAALASAEETRLKAILAEAGLAFIDPGSWHEQAQLAAENRMEDLEGLKGRLKGGRSAE
jgi:predicted flap endonuclease-1-like 5' DNA nuclease